MNRMEITKINNKNGNGKKILDNGGKKRDGEKVREKVLEIEKGKKRDGEKDIGQWGQEEIKSFRKEK